MKFTIQPPSVVMATSFLPMASPHQLAPTSAGLTSEPSLYISLTIVAISLTSGVSRVAVLLSSLAKLPPFEKTNGAKRAQSAPMQNPLYVPASEIFLAAARKSSQVHESVGSSTLAGLKGPRQKKQTGRGGRPR